MFIQISAKRPFYHMTKVSTSNDSYQLK